MNRAFDHNGVIVAPSKPVRQLRTVKKTVLIDSADRDTVKYVTNGDVVYFLPRVYENIVSIRLKSATFPPLVGTTGGGGIRHSYINGENNRLTNLNSDTGVTSPSTYFLIEFEGLNKSDETVVASQRSSFPDNFFARIPVVLELAESAGIFAVHYNDRTFEENIGRFSPPIGKLDRIHIITRLHDQQNKTGFIYWTNDGVKADVVGDILNYSLVLEIEYIDNVFDDFSSTETRISERGFGGIGC